MSADVGDDVVALQAARGYAYGMEGVTAAVWHLLADAKSEDEVVAALTETYDVSEPQCRTEVAELLHQLVTEGLVERIAA